MKLENSTNPTLLFSEEIDTNATAPDFLLNRNNNKGNVRVIILGFNDFEKDSDNIPNFDMYFTTLDKTFDSSFMKMPINIKYKNNLKRNLENENGDYN